MRATAVLALLAASVLCFSTATEAQEQANLRRLAPINARSSSFTTTKDDGDETPNDEDTATAEKEAPADKSSADTSAKKGADQKASGKDSKLVIRNIKQIGEEMAEVAAKMFRED